ncbi:hypothetical protein K3G64_17305 [Mycobacterium sp. IDR2000157661]|nr:hypothetical protein K3G64_17305 [Mycobacterium sp. IDR2000157661]
MGMAPEGIPLADGGEDRDLLEMDTLHLRLGPVLPYWPAGLVVGCNLNGDVITEARAFLVDATADGADPSEPTALGGALQAARQCDHVRDLLALAGWARGAALARRCRDLLLARDDENAGLLLAQLHRGARRSALLRWSLREVGSLSGDELGRRGLPEAFEGDAYRRLLARLDAARELMSDPLQPNPFRIGLPVALDVLPQLIGGLDIAAARLAVAGLGIDTFLHVEADVA